MPSVYDEPFAFSPLTDPFEANVRLFAPFWRMWADAAALSLSFWSGAAPRTRASDVPGDPAGPVGPEIDVPNAPEELPPAIDPQPPVEAPPPATTGEAGPVAPKKKRKRASEPQA